MIRGLHGQRARDRHALAHAARELLGVLVLGARQADLLDPAARDRLALGRSHAAQLEAEGDVLEHGVPGVRAVALEDHAAVRPRARDGLATQDDDLAGRRAVEAGDHAQDRALAAARRSEEDAELADGRACPR